MLFLSNELKWPNEGGGSGWYEANFEACRPYLGKYALLRNGFSWDEAALLWQITQHKYEYKNGGGIGSSSLAIVYDKGV